MMAGIHHMEQVRFGDTQHFEGRDAHPDPETSCTSNYDMPGDMEQDLQHIYNNYNALQEMVDIQSPVVLNPEVLMCGTNLHPEPQLTFSSDGLKLEYLDSYSGQDGDLITLFWEVSDIISIDCKWIQMVQSALMTLHVSSNAETVNSGPVKVEFCLADPQWEWKQQKIWQLNSRFQEVWKNIQLDDFASQNWSADPSLCFPKKYFDGIDHFEDVIYPKGERDAVSISTRDVELLLPEIFVNDTIIDFYIKYLTQRIEPTERHRYHFFSSFFFRKLADLDKDQENAPKGREAFLGVRKWTRKIDVFAKEFLFIPVNFSLHWSLLVICYPGEVDTFKDGDARIAGKLPCIMHMNSIKGTHTGLKDIIQSYLWEEWKERHPESASDSSDKFLNLRFLSLELPQQDNLFDCGLFLLHYVERFLTDAPRFFNPMKIDVFSSFLGDGWFVPAEASLKRSLIQKLIHELVTEPSKTYPKLVCGDEKHDERHHRTENAMGEVSRELIGQGCFAAEPDSVCGILGAHQQSKLICLNDSEKGLSVPGCTLETGGVSMVAQQEMQMCPSDDDIVVCSPSHDAKNEPFFAYSGNKLDPKSCAPVDAEEFKGSCSVVKEDSLLDILDSNQKISSHAEVEVHEHDIMVFECCPFSDNVNKVMSGQGSRNEVEYDRHEASQDMDCVMRLDASKHDTGTGQESTEGKTGNGRCDLSEDTDSFATGCMKMDAAEHSLERNIVKAMDGGCDISEDARSVMINDMNSGFAEFSSERNTVEVVDPGAVEDDTKAEKTSTATGTINDNEQYVSSESKDGNSGSIMTSGSTVPCGLKEGRVAADTTNGTSETHADGEDACHNLAIGEVAPCEDDTTCTGAEMSHVKGISTCRAKDGTFSEKATSTARRPLLGSTSEDKIILVSDDTCLLKGVQCTEDDIIKGSTKEETSTISDKIKDNKQYASSEFRDGNSDNAIAGENTQGSDVDGHELAAFPCEGDTAAEMPPHVDGTWSAEYENNSISDSIYEATKMQVSDEFGSTSEDDIIEGSTKEETDTAADKMNGRGQYASYELEDGNTNGASNDSEQRDVSSEANNEMCCVGAKRPFADSSICEAKEMVTFDDKFWQERSERSEARFGRRYKRRIVWKRRKVIFCTPPSSDSD
uniref:Uncharacterized protein n=1 Tax=Avena sativa TaxID=4498 RepID=A0ACD5VT55_AVESA